MTPDDPIRLIERIVNKDREAFGRFYDRFAPLLYGLALRILRSQPDAEEVVQDVFHAVWQKARDYEKRRGSPEAWIITMTRSRAIDKLRARRRRDQRTTPIEEPFEIVDDAPAEERTDARLSVEGILEKLPEAQREALGLAYYEGFTQSEIAVRLDVPLGTVKTRIRDGLKRLREFLGKGERAGHEPRPSK
ncbi:MAG: sigma-70 family RNA polymerase sigma factor [Candidatus Omnitrophota bacterium]